MKLNEPSDTSQVDLLRSEATAWLIRLQCGHPSKQLWAEFEVWLAGDRRRRSTYYQMEREWPARRERLKRTLIAAGCALSCAPPSTGNEDVRDPMDAGVVVSAHESGGVAGLRGQPAQTADDRQSGTPEMRAEVSSEEPQIAKAAEMLATPPCGISRIPQLRAHWPATVVYVVDADPEARRALGRLLRAAGCSTRSFGSAGEFLASREAWTSAGCIIAEVTMPGLNGLELQECLTASGCRRPIIFLTGNGDISKSVRAMKAGAVSFLTKPVDDRELLAAVEEALRIDAAERARWSTQVSISQRLSTLTPRERQVLDHVVAGRLNKQIAAELGMVEKTIKVHRARVMRKMHATSLVELVHLAKLVTLTSSTAPPEALPHCDSNAIPVPAERQVQSERGVVQGGIQPGGD